MTTDQGDLKNSESGRADSGQWSAVITEDWSESSTEAATLQINHGNSVRLSRSLFFDAETGVETGQIQLRAALAMRGLELAIA